MYFVFLGLGYSLGTTFGCFSTYFGIFSTFLPMHWLSDMEIIAALASVTTSMVPKLMMNNNPKRCSIAMRDAYVV